VLKKKKKVTPSQVPWLKSNPTYLGVWSLGRIWFEVSLDKKFESPHLNQWLYAVAYTCYPGYVEKHK
jgi:hypothetical protein